MPFEVVIYVVSPCASLLSLQSCAGHHLAHELLTDFAPICPPRFSSEFFWALHQNLCYIHTLLLYFVTPSSTSSPKVLNWAFFSRKAACAGYRGTLHASCKYFCFNRLQRTVSITNLFLHQVLYESSKHLNCAGFLSPTGSRLHLKNLQVVSCLPTLKKKTNKKITRSSQQGTNKPTSHTHTHLFLKREDKKSIGEWRT